MKEFGIGLIFFLIAFSLARIGIANDAACLIIGLFWGGVGAVVAQEI